MKSRWLWLLVSAGLLAACTSAPPVSPQQALNARAQAYWEARRLNDMQTLYAMESAAEPRGKLTPFEFAEYYSNKPSLRAAGIKQIVVDKNQGTVVSDVTILLPMPGSPAITKPQFDSWILLDGQWYLQTGEHKTPSQQMQQLMLQKDKAQPGDDQLKDPGQENPGRP